MKDPDEQFSYRAYREAMRRRRAWRGGYKEGDVIEYIDFFVFPLVSRDFERQVHYWKMRLDGESHNMADMLANRSFPATTGTDRAFMQGRKLGGGQFEDVPLVGHHHAARAEAAGVSTTGKWYSGTLARFPGDPEAWVDSLHDVKTICERRGWSAEGAIKVEGPRYHSEEPRPYRVANDIVDEHVAQVLDAHPELVPKAHEIREEVQGRLSGVHG